MFNMDIYARQIEAGESHFGSGSVNSPAFNRFAREFKKSLHKLLKVKGCDKITFKKGHFELSGFFTYKQQAYYFSLADVRWNAPQLLYRTVKNYSDYTGGINQFVTIGDDMEDRMNLKGK